MQKNEIDWSKPVEAFYGKGWREVSAVMRNHDGSVHETNYFCYVVAFSDGGYISVPSKNIRNKPEPLEVWLNVYAGGPGQYCYKSKELADRSALPNRTRCARMVEVID
jgi:hypothetical protein